MHGKALRKHAWRATLLWRPHLQKKTITIFFWWAAALPAFWRSLTAFQSGPNTNSHTQLPKGTFSLRRRCRRQTFAPCLVKPCITVWCTPKWFTFSSSGQACRRPQFPHAALPASLLDDDRSWVFDRLSGSWKSRQSTATTSSCSSASRAATTTFLIQSVGTGVCVCSSRTIYHHLQGAAATTEVLIFLFPRTASQDCNSKRRAVALHPAKKISISMMWSCITQSTFYLYSVFCIYIKPSNIIKHQTYTNT